METHDPRPSPPGLVSPDDDGLWMKLDSSPNKEHTESPSIASAETPQAPPAVITRYYSVMDNEDADDVFIPPPPPPSLPAFMAPLIPAEGSTDATANNSIVTLSNEAADATEAKANPSGLDWHHGEKQLKAAQVDQVTAQILKASMDLGSLSNNKNFTLATDTDPTSVEGTSSLMETCPDTHGRRHPAATDRKSNEETEGRVIVSAAERYFYPEQNSDNDPHSDSKGDTTRSSDICGLADNNSNLTAENADSDSVKTSAPTLSGLGVDDDDFKSCGITEVHKCNQNNIDGETNQLQVAEIPADETTDDQDFVDNRSFDHNLTKDESERRECDMSGKRVLQLPTSEGTDETATKAETGDGSRKIASHIQQGEILLQRLQLVQQRQDVHMSESHLTSQQVVHETGDEQKGTSGTEVDDRTMCEGDEQEKNKGKDTETTARESSSMPDQTEHRRSIGAEAEKSEMEQCENLVLSDLPLVNPQETSTTKGPVPSARHRFSAAETSIEILEADQGKQNLQRAGGVFNLTDDPDDVLEIPFKTNISLKLFPSKDGQGQQSSGQFSEQKMQKEISQDLHRELALVNQGKIPGGYSKGEIRQLKETKLVFEAFQQENTEGPTRHRKPGASVIKGHVYPSVLERTRSLEMFRIKSCPVSRAQSLRLYKPAATEHEKSPENLRSRSPNGGSQDKTRLSPYPKKDKHLHVCRSMDSLSPDVSGSAVETRSKTREGNTRQDSPIFKHNPFFKLRPALALQSEVEKDIREAREREEELRRQRSTLYGEKRKSSREEEKSRFTKTPDVKQSTGKLDRVWPPLSRKEQTKSEQTQQEPRVHRAGGEKAPLWQLWESGRINGQPPQEENS
ncbi:hypothetical protein EXN66_Car016291 [Channa argus]|uniref:Uncharacterized protein n=1 Tax=Channa argus TaxID=215402 RepID=A0A6G1QDV5_CHAAH|nr:hypothetical protein EXN66_Car016291 [Channa argus]